MASKDEAEHDNLDRWLLTYADLITLLLGLFVILYSMSRLDAQRFGQFAAALSGVFSGGRAVLQGEHAGVVPQASVPAPPSEEEQLKELGQKVEEALSASGLYPPPQASVEQRGLVIHFAGNVLFDSGQASLRPEAKQALLVLAQLLRTQPRPVRVEGHTDNVPISTSVFASNWELSAARAATVARFLVERGLDAKRVSAAGYGEHRPAAGNDTEQGRQLNRRVDVILLSLKEAQKEPGGGPD
jgi:chemotaxis protein MotB